MRISVLFYFPFYFCAKISIYRIESTLYTLPFRYDFLYKIRHWLTSTPDMKRGLVYNQSNTNTDKRKYFMQNRRTVKQSVIVDH